MQGAEAGSKVVVNGRDRGEAPTPPLKVTIRLNGSTPVTLRAEALRSSLRISPKPAGATVVLDGVPVGRGAWRVMCGLAGT